MNEQLLFARMGEMEAVMEELQTMVLDSDDGPDLKSVYDRCGSMFFHVVLRLQEPNISFKTIWGEPSSLTVLNINIAKHDLPTYEQYLADHVEQTHLPVIDLTGGDETQIVTQAASGEVVEFQPSFPKGKSFFDLFPFSLVLGKHIEHERSDFIFVPYQNPDLPVYVFVDAAAEGGEGGQVYKLCNRLSELAAKLDDWEAQDKAIKQEKAAAKAQAQRDAEPPKPDCVPAEAVWNGAEKEWEIGEKKADGTHVGDWKWWLAPAGYLVCETTHADDGSILYGRRYHPNGEVSRIVEKGKPSIFFASDEPTIEMYPPGDISGRSVKAITARGFYDADHYDADGNLIDCKMNLNNYKSVDGESVDEAFARLDRFIADIPKHYADYDNIREVVESYRPKFGDKLTAADIAAIEKKFSITLPPSYVEFVTTRGLLQLREAAEFFEPEEFETLADVLGNPDEADIDFSDEPIHKATLEKCVTYATGYELYVRYYTFNFNVLNEQGEPAMVRFHDSEWGYILDNDFFEPCATTIMQELVSEAIDTTIDSIANAYELED